MQIFGLISLLLAVGIGVWLWSGTAQSPAPTDDTAAPEANQDYTDILDEAQQVADTVSERSTGATAAGSVTVYDGISVPADTQTLDLSNRGLEGSLKAEIRQLTELRELDLSHNNFTGVPAEVGQLSKLEVLDLSDNPLTGLPHEIGNLRNIKIIDLRNTDYSDEDFAAIVKQLPAGVDILLNK